MISLLLQEEDPLLARHLLSEDYSVACRPRPCFPIPREEVEVAAVEMLAAILQQQQQVLRIVHANIGKVISDGTILGQRQPPLHGWNPLIGFEVSSTVSNRGDGIGYVKC